MRVLLLAVMVMAAAQLALADPLLTPFEVDSLATPRYAETMEWCRELALRSASVTMLEFGESPEGRALPLMVWDPDGLHDPESIHRAHRTVLLVDACIHAGESCGKDAGMMWMRDLAANGGPPHVSVLFIPIFNVDGHERFGPHNRVNQNGPREMGWRVTAQNLNLNRDFLKADTPEMQAFLALWNQWRPHFFVDIHSTDGADYQYPVTYGLELNGNLDEGLVTWNRAYLTEMERGMEAAGYPMAPYVSFRKWHDPQSGLRSWVAGPRFSQGYAAVRNRPGLLIEAHMLKPYPVRVRATQVLLEQTLDYLSRNGFGLRNLTAAAEERAASALFRMQTLPLRWEGGDQSRPFTFLGVEYERRTSALSGGEYFVYHGDRPDTFTVEFFDQPEVTTSARVPSAYLVPAQWTDVVDRLRWHGVALERITEDVTLKAGAWRLNDCSWREQPYEGRHPVSYEAEPFMEVHTVPAGTWLVDMAQAEARVAVHLLDPDAPDALLRWGFFDAQLTRVEYVESYVIEAMMEQMVVENPALVDSLEARKAADPEFAANPRAIRDWFYRQTPYYDDRAFVYPVRFLMNPANVRDLPRSREF